MSNVPAFPVAGTSSPGMGLRDYFAARAMQAFIQKPVFQLVDSQSVAAMAYMIADAMIEARES